MNPTNTTSDHDLLITLHEQVRNIGVDIKEIKDGTALTLSDHEKRIRQLEDDFKDFDTVKKLVFGAVGAILLSFIGTLIYLTQN